MADLHVGPGQTYTNLSTAFAASSAGDILCLHADTYTGVNNIGLVVPSQLTLTNYQSDLVLVDAEAGANYCLILGAAASGTIFEGITFSNPLLGCIYLSGCDNCTFRTCRFSLDPAVAGAGCVVRTTTADYTFVDNCFLFGNGGTPANAYGISGEGPVLVRRSTFYNLAIGMNRSDVALVDRCMFYTIGFAVFPDCNAVADVVLVTNSVFYGYTFGIYDAGTQEGCITALNNTFDGEGTGRAIYTSRYLAAISNNVFYDNSRGIEGTNFLGTPAPDTNCYFNNATDILNYTADAGPVTGDPRFTDPATHDYRISPVSSCLDTGSGAALIVNNVHTDFRGILRPQDAGYDIGAYEYLLGRALVCGSRFLDPSGVGGGSTASFVNTTTLAETAASVVNFRTDIPTNYSQLSGLDGTVLTASPTIFTSTAAPFHWGCIDAYLCVWGTATPANSGRWPIIDYDRAAGTYVVLRDSTFTTDLNNGNIIWAIVPSWWNPLWPVADISAVSGSFIEVVEPILGLPVGSYYVKITNPGGSFLFRGYTYVVS